MRDLGAGSSGDGVRVAPARPVGWARAPLAAPEQGAASNAPRTIGEALRAHAALRPEQAAIVASELAPVSYRRLTEQIEEVCAVLRQAGFDASAGIVVAIPDTAPAALAIVAVACSAVALPLDPKPTLPEIEARLVLLRPNAVLLLRGSRTAARTAAEQQGIAIIEATAAADGRLGLQLLAPQVGPAPPLQDPDPNAPAFILQTSGTTADPNWCRSATATCWLPQNDCRAGSIERRRIAACARRRYAIPTASR